MRIVVDAMGSDDHPKPDVAGAVEAAREFGDTIILVGDEAQIKAELATQTAAACRWKLFTPAKLFPWKTSHPKLLKASQTPRCMWACRW